MKFANNKSSSGAIPRIIRPLIVAVLLTTTALAAPGGFNHSPVRFWSFSEFAAKITDPILVAGDGQQGGRLKQTFDFGTVIFDTFPPDGIARGEILSSASGKTFSVFAQAPIGSIHESGSVIGDNAVLDQYQSYEKKKDDATLQINISKIFLDLIDANGSVLLPSECPPGLFCPLIEGTVIFEARVYSLGAGGDFFYTKGEAGFSGWQGHWRFSAGTSADARTPLWTEDSFFVNTDSEGTGDFSHAVAELLDLHGVVLNVDLSPVLPGELFAVEVRMEARAVNMRGRESAVSAFIRDPQKVLPALVQTTGLKRLGPPPLPPPPLQPLPPVDCPNGPDPNSGTFQFSALDYVTGEQAGALSKVIVTRIDGSVGAASVTLTTSDGTALSGVDYTSVSKTINFSDGDTSPRIVEIPILRDSDPETEESLNLTLSDPVCATLGQTTQALLTIVDDERVIDDGDSFSLGGTVSGLTGSGLELVNFGGADEVDITADGSFQFPLEYASGVPYSVTVGTQPSNPAQVCTMTNGEGTFTDHDITDILVECTDVPTSGLDPTFGDGGLVSTSLGESEALLIQTDGNIVSAGNNGVDFALTRHDTNGVLDPTFGGDGIVTTDFAGGLISSDEAFDLAQQTDGKIISVGSASNTTTVTDFAVARYNNDGTLDTTFSDGGMQTTDFGLDTDGDGIVESGADVAEGVAIQPDGKIIVAGHARIPLGGGLGFDNDFALARYNPDGTIDTTFGNNGKVTTNIGTDSDIGTDVVLQADGKIIVVGQIDQATDFAIVRYNSDGTLDDSFGGSGIIVSDFSGSEGFEGVAIQSDGRIVATGFSTGSSATLDFAIVRYEPDGDLDSSFGNGGLVTTDVSGGIPFGHDFGEDIILQNDGKIVVVGRNTSNTILDLAIVRYNTDGTLDSSFVNNGILSMDLHGKGDFGQDIAIQSDGKIVAGGYSANGNNLDFVLVRVLP